jgi:CDP-6-deoxy-D-xylo-4-hexulose-3-dehydrase
MTAGDFVPGVTSIPLSVPTFDADEIVEAIDSLMRMNVTMGRKVAKFERMFSDYLGTRNSIAVNSGSSADLVALSILAQFGQDRLRPSKQGHEVITPALTWPTAVSSIVNVGARPVFVDVELDTFDLDPTLVEEAVNDKTVAIMPVHLLGNPCKMKEIEKIAQEHDLFVVEDACEAPGAEVDGKKVGTFGDMGTFSFFFSHHISTIEGGMIVTDNDEYADLARSIRAHGWIRERSDREELSAKYRTFDKRFLFVALGYNLRPTEIQGAFGIHQIGKLDKFIRARERNARYWTNELSRYREYLSLPESRPGVRHVFFGYPVTVKHDAPFTRDELALYLESKHIETRPIMSGDLTQHPVCRHLSCRIAGNLRNTRLIHSQSLLWGNHQGIGDAERRFIVESITDFIEKHRHRSEPSLRVGKRARQRKH